MHAYGGDGAVCYGSGGVRSGDANGGDTVAVAFASLCQSVGTVAQSAGQIGSNLPTTVLMER